jgi:hypothetical protein
MVATLEERIDALEKRLGAVEAALNPSHRLKFAVTVEEARERLKQPVERGPEELEQLHRIFGRFEGPPDLSTRMRDYLYGERE